MNENRRVLIIKTGEKDVLDNAAKSVADVLEKEDIMTKEVFVPAFINSGTAIRAAIRSMELKSSDTRYIGYIVLAYVTSKEAGQFRVTKDYIIEQGIRSVEKISAHYSLAHGIAVFMEDEKNINEERANNAGEDCLEMLKMKKYIGLN
jgi:hypothetical protein